MVTSLINHGYVMLLLMVSGNPAVDHAFGQDRMIILTFLIGGMLFLLRRAKVSFGNVLFLSGVGALMLVHMSLFGFGVFNASVSFMLQLITAFMLMATVPRFLVCFVNCMFVISLVALPLYFFFWLPGTADVLRPLTVYESFLEWNIGIHNFRGYGYELARNSGPFWEPGAFGGYLALALFAMVLLRERAPQSKIVAGVLMTALFTTLSTMAYAAFLLVCFAFLVQRFRRSNPLIAFVGFPAFSAVLVAVALIVVEELPFLKEKVVEQFEESAEGEENSEINRFGNAQYDWEFFLERPIFGWSANVDTRIRRDLSAAEVLVAQGNALTGTIVRFGLVGWLLLMGRFFVGFRKASGSWLVAGIGMALLAAMFTGEQYLNYPFIMCLFFLERRHVVLKEWVVRRRRKIKVDAAEVAARGSSFAHRATRLLGGRTF